MGREKGAISSPDTFALKNLKKGQSFYTHKPDKDITAISSYHGVKVKTERMFALDANHSRIETLTKVTLL